MDKEPDDIIQLARNSYISAPLSVADYLSLINAIDHFIDACKKTGGDDLILSECEKVKERLSDILQKADIFVKFKTELSSYMKNDRLLNNDRK